MNDDFQKRILEALKHICRALRPEETIVQAALALATLVKCGGKPLAFDIKVYASLCGVVETLTMSDEHFDKASAEELEALASSQEKYRAKLREFIKKLSDAFTLYDVCSVANCVLVEVGVSDLYPALANSEVYMVMELPQESDIQVLDL